jgi:plasmid replication initiation protein
MDNEDVVCLPAPDLFKSNDFIKLLQVKNQMTLTQQKIFDAVLSTVQEMKKKGDLEIANLVREGDLTLDYDLFYEHILKGSRIKKINRKDLEQAMRDIVTIAFSWSSEKEVGAFVLFQKGVINFETRTVNITFGKDFRTENMIPSANFTALSYEYLNKFKSQYTRIVYQYIKMLIGKDISAPFRTDIKLELEFLYALFGITKDSHPEYFANTGSFIKRCIEPAKKEINTFSELNMNYTAIKKGRYIVALHFTFPVKSNYIVGVEIDNTSIKKSKTKSLFDIKNFKSFKSHVIQNYKGKELGNMFPGFQEETVLSIDIDTDYIINAQTKKILTSADSHKVWNYLFKNQDKLGIVFVVSALARTKKFIGRHLETYRINDFGTKEIEVNVIIKIAEEEENKFRITMRDKFDFQGERPIIAKELYTLEEISKLNFLNI